MPNINLKNRNRTLREGMNTMEPQRVVNMEIGILQSL